MFLTFIPTSAIKTFAFNCRRDNGAVDTIRCPGPCHVDVPELCGRNLLRDYPSLFTKGKEYLPNKTKTKADVKGVPGSDEPTKSPVEPTANTSLDAPETVKETEDGVE